MQAQMRNVCGLIMWCTYLHLDRYPEVRMNEGEVEIIRVNKQHSVPLLINVGAFVRLFDVERLDDESGKILKTRDLVRCNLADDGLRAWEGERFRLSLRVALRYKIKSLSPPLQC